MLTLNLSGDNVREKKTRKTPVGPQKKPETSGQKLDSEQEVCTSFATEFGPGKISWLWTGRIALNSLCFLDGDMGCGKSSVLCDLAARVTKGKPMPDGPKTVKGSVLWLPGEESPKIMVIPRLKAAGADLSRIAFWGVSSDGKRANRPRFPGCIPSLSATVEKHDVRLVVVDPYLTYFSTGLSPFIEQDVRVALDPLGEMAEQTNCAVVCVRHPNKNTSQKRLYRGGGSVGISAIARTVLWVGEHFSDPEKRILSMTKSNVGAFPSSLAYSIVPEGKTSKVVWHGAVEEKENDAVAEAEEKGKKSRMEEAQRLLAQALAKGPKAAKDLLREAEESGIGARTLENAKAVLGIVSLRKMGSENRPYWEWSLPKKGG